MDLKNAAFLALIGTALVTILLAVGLIRDVLSSAQGLIPVMTLLTSVAYTFAALTVTLFFYAFHKERA